MEERRKQYPVCECTKMNHELPEIFRALVQVKDYNTWWPRDIDYKVVKATADGIGSTVELSTMLGKVSTEVHSARQNEEVIVKYKEGFMQGDVKWTVSPLSSKQTEVCFYADLKPNSSTTSFLWKLFQKTFLKTQFNQMITSMDSHLRKGKE